MFQDQVSSDYDTVSPSSPEDNEVSNSLNIFFRASARLKTRDANQNESELKKLLLQKSAAASSQLSSISLTPFKKSAVAVKQHRSKKRFLLELSQRLGAGRLPSFDQSSRRRLSKNEVEKNAALSYSLGQLTKFVSNVGSKRRCTPFVNALHDILLHDFTSSESATAPRCDDVSETYYGDWALESSSVTEFDFDLDDSPCSILNLSIGANFFDGSSDYGSTDTPLNSPSEFSDATDDYVPSSPIDFGIGADDMQKLMDSLNSFEDSDFNSPSHPFFM